MIRLMLRAVGLATAQSGIEDQHASLTPAEQLQRFAEVCERLSASDERPADGGDDD